MWKTCRFECFPKLNLEILHKCLQVTNNAVEFSNAIGQKICILQQQQRQL